MLGRKMLSAERGMTLVELLVTTAISLIVLSMAITFYISVKKQQDDLKNKTSVEVKELTAKALIESVVKSAGFACKFGYKNQTPYIDRTGDSLEDYFLGSGSGVRVGALPFSGTNNLPGSLQSVGGSEEAQTGTDYILIRKEDGHTKITTNNSFDTSLSVDDVGELGENDYVTLCNKDHINLVKITSDSSVTNGSSISLDYAPSGSVYYAGDYAGKYELQILYVRGTGEQDDDDNDIFSLYIYVKEGASQGISYELVRGIKDLQVEYATLNGATITWNAVTTDLELDSSYPAIKVLFTVDGQLFSKIISL